jgi:hypothetical protein
MHVVNHDLVRRTGNPFDEFDRFLACGTSCAKYFDFLLCGHGVLLKNLLDFLLTTVGTGCGIVRGVPARPRIPERSDYQYSDRAVYGGLGIPRELAKQNAAGREYCQQERAVPVAISCPEKHGRQSKDEKRNGQGQ